MKPFIDVEAEPLHLIEMREAGLAVAQAFFQGGHFRGVSYFIFACRSLTAMRSPTACISSSPVIRATSAGVIPRNWHSRPHSSSVSAVGSTGLVSLLFRAKSKSFPMINQYAVAERALWLDAARGTARVTIERHAVAPAGRGFSLPPSRICLLAALEAVRPLPCLDTRPTGYVCVREPGYAGAVTRSTGITRPASSGHQTQTVCTLVG